MTQAQTGALTEIGPPSDDACRQVWTKWGEAHEIPESDPRFETIYGLLRREIERLPVGDLVVDAGAGDAILEPMFSRGHYLSIDFVAGGPVMGWEFTNLDILGDVNSLPVASNSPALALSITVLEHTNDPFRTVDEI